MAAELHCDTCKRLVWREGAEFSDVTALMVHIANEHPQHVLRVHAPPGDLRVCFECLICRPEDGKKYKATYNVPRHLVTLIAVSWHSEHEGHRHTVHVDGVQIHPATEEV